MSDMAMSPPSFDGTTSRVVSISSQIMIAIIIVLFFVVAFCFFLHLYIKCYWPNNNEDANIVSWRRQLARQRPSTAPSHRRGLDSASLRALPIVVYNPKDFKDGLECAVCLSEVSEGEKARLLPKCNHGFHVECIDMWFQSHSTCPLCRNPVSSTMESNDTNNNNHDREVQDDEGYYSSDSNSDSDNDASYASASPRTRETLVFPTNVLFWGNETQVSSLGQAANAAAAAAATATASASASSSGASRPRDQQEMVIDIPSHDFCEDCLEEVKTPVMTRLRSLKRLLSLGKRAVAPSPHGSSSCDVVQEV